MSRVLTLVLATLATLYAAAWAGIIGTVLAKRRIALLAAAAALAAPGVAQAAGVENPSVSSDGLLYAAVDAADDWWASQGQFPCPAVIMEYDETERPNVVARGDHEGCTVYFNRAYVREVRGVLREYTWRSARAVYAEICMVGIHERGHNLGLGHDAGGVMLMIGQHPVVGACRAWAAKNAPALRLGKRARAR